MRSLCGDQEWRGRRDACFCLFNFPFPLGLEVSFPRHCKCITQHPRDRHPLRVLVGANKEVDLVIIEGLGPEFPVLAP